MVRGGAVPVNADITGAKEIWLVVQDVDTYDPSRVKLGWAELTVGGAWGNRPLGEATETMEQRNGSVRAIRADLPSVLHFSHDDRECTWLRAKALSDESSRRSDISPAVRFFVFTEKPDLGRALALLEQRQQGRG